MGRRRNGLRRDEGRAPTRPGSRQPLGSEGGASCLGIPRDRWARPVASLRRLRRKKTGSSHGTAGTPSGQAGLPRTLSKKKQQRSRTLDGSARFGSHGGRKSAAATWPLTAFSRLAACLPAVLFFQPEPLKPVGDMDKGIPPRSVQAEAPTNGVPRPGDGPAPDKPACDPLGTNARATHGIPCSRDGEAPARPDCDPLGTKTRHARHFMLPAGRGSRRAGLRSGGTFTPKHVRPVSGIFPERAGRGGNGRRE